MSENKENYEKMLLIPYNKNISLQKSTKLNFVPLKEFVNGNNISDATNGEPCTVSSDHIQLMQMNGRKVLSPPEDWCGPVPTSACELFIRRIPKDLCEKKILEPFLRFGRIYEIRLPMDFNQGSRGYAYVKYTTEEEAACAMEVLNHYYIERGRKMEVLHSYEKCRLFVSNIPKHLNEREIESKLRLVFPAMQRMYTKASANEGAIKENHSNNTMKYDELFESAGNRGHVFVHFPTHMDALEAKKSITPGLIRLWGRDLKVVWANAERDGDMSKSTKTLFVRNVDLTINNRDIIDILVQHVPRTSIRKISKVRTTAFFDFTTREAAELCLKQLQGVVLRGKSLELEWAKPSEQQSLHRMRNTDFDAVLRLKCIANYWNIPIIIYGCYYETEGLQYCAVVLRDAYGNVRATFCIFNCNELVDIHSRLCEVVCVLIETIGGFPDFNYVFLVEKDTAHLLGLVTRYLQTVNFMAAVGVPTQFHFDLNEIIDMSLSITALTHTTEDVLLNAYKESFRTHNDCTYLKNWPLCTHRIFGTIMPKFRNKEPLKHNLNDTQIVLALCYISTGTNTCIPSRPYMPFAANGFHRIYDALRYVTMRLLPIALTQSRFVVTHILSHVQFGGSQYYHPDQRVMLPPIWLTGCTYAQSIKQPQSKATPTTTAPSSSSSSSCYMQHLLHANPEDNQIYSSTIPTSSLQASTTSYSPSIHGYNESLTNLIGGRSSPLMLQQQQFTGAYMPHVPSQQINAINNGPLSPSNFGNFSQNDSTQQMLYNNFYTLQS